MYRAVVRELYHHCDSIRWYSDPWHIDTTDNSTSYTVTGLMFGQSYNFSVSAENCVELGEDSNIVSATLPGEGILLSSYLLLLQLSLSTTFC